MEEEQKKNSRLSDVMEDVLSSESINDVNAQKVSLSGFHGDNLLMYMLAMKQLSSATYVCLGRHKDFFVSCLKLMSSHSLAYRRWRIEVYKWIFV